MTIHTTLTKRNLDEMLTNMIEKHGHDSKEVEFFEMRIENYPNNPFTADEILDSYYTMLRFDLKTFRGF